MLKIRVLVQLSLLIFQDMLIPLYHIDALKTLTKMQGIIFELCFNNIYLACSILMLEV